MYVVHSFEGNYWILRIVLMEASEAFKNQRFKSQLFSSSQKNTPNWNPGLILMLLLFLINKKKNLRQFLFLEGLFHFHICCNSNFMYLAATIRNNEMSGSLKRPSPVTVLIFLKILSGGKKSFCIKHIGTSLLYRFLRPMLFYPFQTALEIAKKGGTVHMICRNPKYAL